MAFSLFASVIAAAAGDGVSDGVGGVTCFAMPTSACNNLLWAQANNKTCCLVPDPPAWMPSADANHCSGLGLGCPSARDTWLTHGYDPSGKSFGTCFCDASSGACGAGTITQWLASCGCDGGVERADPGKCAADIAAAAAQIADAASQIKSAVADCATNPSKCSADIAGAASSLTGAAARVSSAVTDCGGKGSACATDLISLASDLSGAAAKVSSAVGDCADRAKALACASDVLGGVGAVASSASEVVKAAKDCGSAALAESAEFA